MVTFLAMLVLVVLALVTLLASPHRAILTHADAALVPLAGGADRPGDDYVQPGDYTIKPT